MGTKSKRRLVLSSLVTRCSCSLPERKKLGKPFENNPLLDVSCSRLCTLLDQCHSQVRNILSYLAATPYIRSSFPSCFAIVQNNFEFKLRDCHCRQRHRNERKRASTHTSFEKLSSISTALEPNSKQQQNLRVSFLRTN